ncbi:MAG: hypothetical protein A2Y77_05830 [Planctomycetes bacterium RBG_13_62_9]|nr:MAG: hypothetical protein A2Y77_05830 [Planctomycetes bacterium RBG_13_62_9]
MIDNLGRGETAPQPDPRGSAKAAAHRAAHLRGDAQGLPLILRQQHRLDPLPVGQLEQELGRPIGVAEALDDLEPRDEEPPLGQLLAERLAQRADRRQVIAVLRVDELEEVTRQVLGLPQRSHDPFQLFQRLVLEIRAHAPILPGENESALIRPRAFPRGETAVSAISPGS